MKLRVDPWDVGWRLGEAQAWRARGVLARRGVKVPPLGPLRVVAEPSAYGTLTEAGERAAAGAAALGLPLDATYGAKAYALAEQEGAGCFVVSGNGHPEEPLLRGALTELPPRLAACLVRG